MLDANQAASKAWRGLTASVVGQWLTWEVDRSTAVLTDTDPDLVFLVFSGSIDWRRECRRALVRAGIEPDPAERRGSPLVVTGGPVDATPRQAFLHSDALIVGEGYRTVRNILAAPTPYRVRRLLADSPHAITRDQWLAVDPEPDAERPWLMRAAPSQPLARPDDWIDWSVPDVRSDDRVIRVVGSKGCHLKCGFCATTYRQRYQARSAASLKVRTARHDGKRLQVLSNDPLNLDGFREVQSKLDHASLTVMELADDRNRQAIIARRPRIIRVGVEGVSAPLRVAQGKPISASLLIDLLSELHASKIRTHAFWIPGLPFEDQSDQREMWAFYERLNDRIEWGLHRAKPTMFQPNPPAPLTRYLPGVDVGVSGQTMVAMSGASQWKRIRFIASRKSALWKSRVADQLGVRTFGDLPQAPSETVDLAPTFDDWTRMPHEAIEWPLSAAQRYKWAETYPRRLRTARMRAAA